MATIVVQKRFEQPDTAHYVCKERNKRSHSHITVREVILREATSKKLDTTGLFLLEAQDTTTSCLYCLLVYLSVHSFLVPFVPSLNAGARQALLQTLFLPYTTSSLSFLIYAHGFN